MRNFLRVLSGLDVAPLLAQVAAHPELWNINDVRTSKPDTVHYAIDDIILRFPRHTPYQWNLPAFTRLSEAQAIVFAIMTQVQGEMLGRVLISRLPPGKSIPPHDDHLPNGPMFYQRYQVPLVSDDTVQFHCGEETMALVPGNAYWFDNTITHSVVNDSERDRLSMVVDIRPFQPPV